MGFSIGGNQIRVRSPKIPRAADWRAPAAPGRAATDSERAAAASGGAFAE